MLHRLKLQSFTYITAALLVVSAFPLAAQAAGVTVTGSGKYTVGQTFTASVVASGTSFNAFQGAINVSGAVSVVSVSAGDALWASKPAIGSTFYGALTSPTSSFTVATIKLKGTKEGTGSLSVSGVQLALNGSYVGSNGSSATFTINRAPTPPSGVDVSSPTHPDQATAYEATSVEIDWRAPANGANGYSYVWDAVADTTPGQTINTKDTSVKFDNVAVGVHYFHIRAQNGDGWGPVTHFKVTIKEPDPKVDQTLGAPTITQVQKNGNFINDIQKGTVSGFTISGNGGLSGYTLNLIFDPKDKLPSELFAPVATTSTSSDKAAVDNTDSSSDTAASTTSLTPLQATPDSSGNWQINLTYPIPSGFYTLTAQSQKDKSLSSLSQPVYLELSVAHGGSVAFITSDDLPKADSQSADTTRVLGITLKKSTSQLLLWGVGSLLVVAAAALLYWLIKRRRRA